MQVKDLEMYHYHRKGIHDEMWKEGNEFEINDDFRSYFSLILDDYSTGVKINDPTSNEYATFSEVIKEALRRNEMDQKPDYYKRVLDEAMKIIINTNILHREMALEKYRMENHPELPSRIHSIWLCDECAMKHWENKLHDEAELFLVKVSGTLFQSSDKFIPDNELTMKQMYEASKEYWNPVFKTEKEIEQTEYLFQGKIKILKKIK